MAITKEAMRDIALGRGGSYSLSRDVIKHQVWDTREFAVSDFTFYTQPLGSPWRNSSVKSLNETNMSAAGQLPNGQTLLVKRIGISLISVLPAANTTPGDTAQAFYNLVQSSVFEIKIAGREYDLQMHGRQFLPAVALSGETATDIGYGRVGDFVSSGWYSLGDTPIFIDQLVNFNVLHRLSNPDSNVTTVLSANASLLSTLNASLQVTLEGVLTRAK